MADVEAGMLDKVMKELKLTDSDKTRAAPAARLLPSDDDVTAHCVSSPRRVSQYFVSEMHLSQSKHLQGSSSLLVQTSWHR